MKTLKDKLMQAIFYDVLAVVIAIALPIALENGWACIPGALIAMFLTYEVIVYYKAIKLNDYIAINATCVKKARGNIGAMTYSEKCYFQPDKSEKVHGIIELQIATENNALINSNKFRRKKKRQGNDVLIGDVCELVFEKPANYSDAEQKDALDYTNANFIALSVIGAAVSSPSETVEEESETISSENAEST